MGCAASVTPVTAFTSPVMPAVCEDSSVVPAVCEDSSVAPPFTVTVTWWQHEKFSGQGWKTWVKSSARIHIDVDILTLLCLFVNVKMKHLCIRGLGNCYEHIC